MDRSSQFQRRPRQAVRFAFRLTRRHVYRFELHNPNKGMLDWIVDPYAREYATGKLSAFTLGYIPYAWSESEKDWKTPALHDLILYELNLASLAQVCKAQSTV